MKHGITGVRFKCKWKLLNLGKYLQGTFRPHYSQWQSEPPSVAYAEAADAIWDALVHFSWFLNSYLRSARVGPLPCLLTTSRCRFHLPKERELNDVWNALNCALWPPSATQEGHKSPAVHLSSCSSLWTYLHKHPDILDAFRQLWWF